MTNDQFLLRRYSDKLTSAGIPAGERDDFEKWYKSNYGDQSLMATSGNLADLVSQYRKYKSDLLAGSIQQDMRSKFGLQ